MGQRCPYPAFYEERLAHGDDGFGLPATALPVDSQGACVFHSRDAAWKREHGFRERFLQLVELLNRRKAEISHDFAEFAFVGIDDGPLRLANLTFAQQAEFKAATFLDSVVFDHVDFQRGAGFKGAAFRRDLKFQDVQIHGLEMSAATVGGLAHFTGVQFLDYALFDSARFGGTRSGGMVTFEKSRFQGITDFSNAAFLLGPESSAVFSEVHFEDFVNFHAARFQCHVAFDDVIFGFVSEFIDTAFDSIGSSARFRGAAVEFNRIEVTADAVLTFKSTNARDKMFHHDVQMSFKTDPAGSVRFDNVDFSKISSPSRARLLQMAKLGKVEIGAGCIKYRYQTPVRTVSVSEDNAPLVIELCQTFTNYFTRSNGLNLGFEIVERDRLKISFFYFTDEDISEEVFLERLEETERRLWNLLSVRGHRQLPILEEAAGALSTRRESAVINAVDGISALMGTFFRVGTRIALGVWKEADTQALLSAIRFNEAGAEDRASNLHRVIAGKYTGQALFGISGRQNQLLLPMVAEGNVNVSGKVRILFLGANSLEDPLALERELKKIQTTLRLAREHVNLEFTQEWAVTVDTLTQAMVDASPNIVHFSGHGQQSGILLQDEAGEPRVVTGDALARLFRLFKDTVRCVVLNSCYSEHQAQAIRLHIPYVIGMSDKIPDAAAIAFATGFYQAVGAGREIPFAFALGLAKIELEGLAGKHIPVLL